MRLNRTLIPVVTYICNIAAASAYIPPPPVDILNNQSIRQIAGNAYTTGKVQEEQIEDERQRSSRVKSQLGSVRFIDYDLSKLQDSERGTYETIIDDFNQTVGLRIFGGPPSGATFIIAGNRSNTYTGDTIISGNNNFVALAKTEGAKAIQENIIAKGGGGVRFDENNQLSTQSVITLKRGQINFLEYNNRSVSNSFHQLRVENISFINFGRTSIRGDQKEFIYIDDLVISDGSRLRITEWKEGRDFLLVRKDSTHLSDALKKLDFEGYDRNAIHLDDYNKDYWSISGAPEPETYGALIGAIGLGIVAYRRRLGVALRS